MIEELEKKFIKKFLAQYKNTSKGLPNNFFRLYIHRIPSEYRDFLSDDDLIDYLINRFEYIRKVNKLFEGNDKLALHIEIEDTSKEFWLVNSHSIEMLMQNMPFIKDSIMEFLQSRGYRIRFYIHPVFEVKTKNGEVTDILETGKSKLMINDPDVQFHGKLVIDYSENFSPKLLKKDLHSLAEDIFHVTNDFSEMKSSLISIPEGGEQREFIDWMLKDNFVFFGTSVQKSSYGMFRKKSFLKDLNFSVSKKKSGITFHRTAYVNYINRRGHITLIQIGKALIAGQFSRQADSTGTNNIPYLKQELNKISKNHPLWTHLDAQDFLYMLNLLPLELRFTIKMDKLLTLSDLVNKARQKIESMLRIRLLNANTAHMLILWPINEYDDQVKNRLNAYLRTHGIKISSEINKVLSSIMFLYYELVLPKNIVSKFNDDKSVLNFENEVYQNLISWEKKLLFAIQSNYMGKVAYSIEKVVLPNFSDEYRARNSLAEALHDINNILQLRGNKESKIIGYQHEDNASTHLILYLRESYTLSFLVPILSNFGLDVIDENLYVFHIDESELNIFKFHITYGDSSIDNEKKLNSICTAFEYILLKKGSSEPLNKLIMLTGLTIHQVELLKALIAYMIQIKKGYSRVLIKSVLVRFPHLATGLVHLAEFKFLSLFGKSLFTKNIQEHLSGYLSDLGHEKKIDQQYLINKEKLSINIKPSTLVQKEITESLKQIVSAIVRTTYFTSSSTLAFKIDSNEIPYMVRPAPYYETWIYHPYFEGIHLRGGPISRGGIRWSTRSDDFRTEVLGLWKTQVLKNTIIVPTGAKGGFALKYLRNVPENGIWAYKIYINALLELVNNVEKPGSKVKRIDPFIPVGDEIDTYLVVAADKGTATFSDYANEISMNRGFWLSDAFASGGENGYSHKALGITAKGAWESARWHFYIQNKNLSKDSITVVGIGDMSGDVFGNGMLLSNKVELLAAFNHKYIFIDPNPDLAVSFNERKRLFKQALQWSEYDIKKISAGGGVYDRESISIKLSTEVQKSLGIIQDVASGQDLIKFILSAPVHMIFNGGIGTYIKASNESHHEVDDISNDNVRVNAADVRAMAVVEGGNLGISPRGRIEFALAGGIINTDAIDNSAGVDLSDHEVNLKILFDLIIREKSMSWKVRNDILQQLSHDEVELVLTNNFRQNSSITYQMYLPKNDHENIIEAMEIMIRSGRIPEKSEELPSAPELRNILERQGSLIRPVISILHGYLKLELYEKYIDIPDSFRQDRLESYFPDSLKKYSDIMKNHPLANDIARLMVINEVVDHAGISYFVKAGKYLSLSFVDAVNRYMFAAHSLQIGKEIRLDYEVDDQKREFPKSYPFSILQKLRQLKEKAIFDYIEITQLFPDENELNGFPKSLDAMTIKSSIVEDNKTLPDWTKKLPTKLKDIILQWSLIELVYMVNTKASHDKQVYREKLLKYYLTSNLCMLKKSLYQIRPDNRWEARNIFALKKKFWNGVMNLLHKGDIKSNRIVEIESEISRLKEMGEFSVASIFGLVDYLFPD